MKNFFCLFILIFIFLFSCKSQKNDFILDNKSVRIISLAPSITRILCDLELKDYLVGVTDYCKYNGIINSYVEDGKIKRVSGFNFFNFEAIVSLSPTFILGMDSVPIESKSKLDKLFDNTNMYWFYHPKNIKEIEEQVSEVASIFGRENISDKLLADFDRRLDKIQRKISSHDSEHRPTVLVEIYSPPFTTAGVNTFISDIVIKSGGFLAFNLNDDWPVISMEDIIAVDPDVIVKTHFTESDKKLSLLSAYKNKRVFVPKNIDLFLQPGLGSIDAIEELYEYLY